jgi:hypothetical protein
MSTPTFRRSVVHELEAWLHAFPLPLNCVKALHLTAKDFYDLLQETKCFPPMEHETMTFYGIPLKVKP